jgi:hypothetical protein
LRIKPAPNFSQYRLEPTGQSEGLAELMVFYCECAAGFSKSVGYEDGVYFDALMRMFEQALKLSVTLPVDRRDVLLDRLDDVRRIRLRLWTW